MGQYRGYPWRFVFTDLGTVTTTWAEGLLTDRKLTYTLDQPATIEASFWPDDRVINATFTDGYPLVAQSKRLIYGFRRDNPDRLGDGNPWQCRAAGILMSPDDEADTDIPLSHVQAWDPWMYLGARPCVHLDGSLPGDLGLRYRTMRPDQIAGDLLLNTITNNAAVNGIGNGTFIDAGLLYGGTAFWGGEIEDTGDPIVFTAQQGMSVADAWSQLCDTGRMDIVLRPIYDVVNRPGYTHELSIYKIAGQNRPTAIFGWDMMNRSTKKINRMHDGTPGNFFNVVQYFAGQGGPPVPADGPLINPPSVEDFGIWWSQQFFPSQPLTSDPTGNTVMLLARQALVLAKQGKRTVTIDPIPGRSPIPLLDYEPGDLVQVYASKRLRTTIAGQQKVQTIPISIDDDGIETVSSLVVCPDFLTSPLPPGGGVLQTSLVSLQTNPFHRRTHWRLGGRVG